MENLSQQKWASLQKQTTDFEIIDVRTEEEFQSGHIPNAVNINISNPPLFMEKMKELDTSKSYFIYCRSGGRSSQACQLLNANGFSKLYNLEGGISKWSGEIIY